MMQDENNIDSNTNLFEEKRQIEHEHDIEKQIEQEKEPIIHKRSKSFTKKNQFFRSKIKENAKFELLLYIIIVSFLFFVLIFIFYYLHYGEYKVDVLLEDKDIIKPMIDMRKYKLINLQNNLQVLLISDKNITKCSASMSVDVGAFNDADIPGLAHFTEHMIFLGSKSYPRPSLFEDHLKNYLGTNNAFTEEEKTTFYFEVEWQGYTKALEMFSRMFAEPLFDKSLMNKEIEAVNSENDKNLNKDPWRENQIIKSLADKDHPYSKFTSGSKNTLRGIDIQTLRKNVFLLYEKFYMPDNMKLVVLSNQNLEQLQQTVAYYFSDIRSEKIDENLRKGNEEMTSNSSNASGNYSPFRNPFTEKESSQIVWYQKVIGGQHLDIIFNLEEIMTKYKTKPLDFVSYLIKYSGEGSLIEYLKQNKLATKIDVGVVASFKIFSQYAISVYLTENGLNNVEGVIQLIFNYLNLIKHNPLKPNTYEELHNITAIQFKFLEKSERYGDYLAVLAGNMLNIKESEYYNILYADYIHSYYNETLIRSYLNALAPKNSLIVIGSRKYPNLSLLGDGKNKTEKWYGTTYRNNKIPNNLFNTLNSSLISGETFKLRDQNEFITKENNVVSCFGVGIITSYKNVTLHELCDMEKADLTPDFAINSKNLLAWYKLDRTFLAPRVNINMVFASSYQRTNSSDYFYLNIYFNYIKSTIDLKLADAKDAGNQINLELNENGIVLLISAFTDLIEKITDRVTQIILNCEIDENNFFQMLEVTKNQLQSQTNNQPYEKGALFFIKLIKHNITTYNEMMKIEDRITYSDFIKQYKIIQKSFYVVSQFYGNMNEKQLLNIESYIQPYLNQDVNEVSKNLKIEDDKVLDYMHYHKNINGSYIFRTINDLPTEVNNAIINYFQVGKRDLRNSLIMNLIELSWENIFYYNLRTVKELGYIVAASKYVKDNYMYFLFLVQGSKQTPDKINLEIDSVIRMVRNKLEYLDEDQLNEYKETILAELNKRNNNLKERSDIVWKEIYENSLDFNRKYKLIEELRSIRLDEVVDMFDNTFYTFGNVKKLSIQIYSKSDIEGAFTNNSNSELYNLNPKITTIISNDLQILNN